MDNPSLYFLSESTLNPHDFNEQVEFLVEGLIAKKMITLFYADGGNGKSWLGFALAKYCASQGLHTIYCDFDNPLGVLKERNINELLVQNYRNLQYIQRGKCKSTPDELLQQLNQQAVGNTYQDCVIVLDSLRNFTNVNNDAHAMQAMTMLMNLREAGATVIILHHANKDGKNYQGSNNIRNSIDNMYELKKLESDTDNGELNVHLTAKKERTSINNAAYKINTHTLDMTPLDETQATMTAEVEAFVEQIKHTLRATPNINKTALLEATGRKKDDKTGRSWLDKYDGVFWHSIKAGGVFTYSLAEQQGALL